MAYVKMSSISLSDVKDPYLLKLVTEIGELVKDEFSETMAAKLENEKAEIPQLYLDGEEYDSVGTVAYKYLKEKPSSEQRKIFKNIKRLIEPTLPDLLLDDEKLNRRFPSPINPYTPLNRDLVNNDLLLKPLLPKIPRLDNTNNHLINRTDLKERFSLLGNIKIIDRIRENLSDLLEDFWFDPNDDDEDNNSNETPPYLNKALNFEAVRVKCYDETGSGMGEWGSDEIYMGGTTVDEYENNSRINDFKVGNFDDNKHKHYSPYKVLHSFPLDNDYSKEVTTDEKGKLFTVFLGLAEQDNGGFGEFIDRLYQAVKKEIEVIIQTLSAALGGAIGAAIGGTVGTALGGPIGGVIGLLAGLAIDYLIGALVSAFNDDIFKPKIATLFLPTADATFSNNLRSPMKAFDYKEHNGHYRVYYRWKIER